MALNRWLTNLESEATMAKAVSNAKFALANAKTADEKRQATALLSIAKFKQADVARSMRQIEIETGGKFTIGPPMATQFRTQQEIAADGIIGIYREGAGTSPLSGRHYQAPTYGTVDVVIGM